MLGFQKRGTKMTPLLKQYTPKGYTQHGWKSTVLQWTTTQNVGYKMWQMPSRKETLRQNGFAVMLQCIWKWNTLSPWLWENFKSP
jgi:hypothetical protein